MDSGTVAPTPAAARTATDEVDAGGSELRQATIFEVQRTRSTIGASLRTANQQIRLGDWVFPAGTNMMIDFQLAHESEDNFPDPDSFNPDRFLGTSPPAFRWIPFGGGVNRCVGAGFAALEMDVALRTLLREFRFAPTDAPGERRHYRGVAIVPARGGRAVVYRREPPQRRVIATLCRQRKTPADMKTPESRARGRPRLPGSGQLDWKYLGLPARNALGYP